VLGCGNHDVHILCTEQPSKDVRYSTSSPRKCTCSKIRLYRVTPGSVPTSLLTVNERHDLKERGSRGTIEFPAVVWNASLWGSIASPALGVHPALRLDVTAYLASAAPNTYPNDRHLNLLTDRTREAKS
jgi:hypothetical protein